MVRAQEEKDIAQPARPAHNHCMSTDNRTRQPKGVSTGGQFATEARSEDPSISLAQIKQNHLLVEPGVPVDLGYEMANSGLNGSLEPETIPDDNLHDGEQPQARYTTPSGRNFSISIDEASGSHEVADADYRDDDGYTHTQDSGTSGEAVSATVKGMVRDRLAYDFAPTEALEADEVEFRSATVSLDDEGSISYHATVSTDEGDYIDVDFDYSTQKITASSADIELRDQELMDSLGLQANEQIFSQALQRMANDSDCDPEFKAAYDKAAPKAFQAYMGKRQAR